MKATSSVLAREPVTETLDWRDVASERLAKITDLEHVLAVTTARLNAMQGERHRLVQQQHAELTALKQHQHAQVTALEQELARLHERRLEEKLEAALRRETELLTSTSWRITRPLRALSVLLARARRLARPSGGTA